MLKWIKRVKEGREDIKDDSKIERPVKSIKNEYFNNVYRVLREICEFQLNNQSCRHSLMSNQLTLSENISLSSMGSKNVARLEFIVTLLSP